jgi:hypothetical protein
VKVYDKKSLTVAVHVITEQNDDVQVIPVGNGKPRVLCVNDGADNILDTLGVGDDGTHPHYVDTGPDGVCETTANNLDPAGDDIQIIPVGSGQPNQTCIAAGANGFRDTAPPGADDVVSGTSITTGPNGICDTTANNTNLVPTTVPSAASLASGLNGIWVQACVEFTATSTSHTLNYDRDRDGNLDDTSYGSAEMGVVKTVASATADINMYYVNGLKTGPTATTFPSYNTCLVMAGTQLTPQTEAHECGHTAKLGRLPHVAPADRLMYRYKSAGALRLIKTEWDKANP